MSKCSQNCSVQIIIFRRIFFFFLNVRLPFYLSVVRWIVCQCSFACTFIPSLCFMPFIFVSFHFSCWHCPNIAILSAFFFAQHSRVLFNFSTDDVSFCHKTPNLFCRLCFYKQTLIIIMWQFNTLLFFFSTSLFLCVFSVSPFVVRFQFWSDSLFCLNSLYKMPSFICHAKYFPKLKKTQLWMRFGHLRIVNIISCNAGILNGIQHAHTATTTITTTKKQSTTRDTGMPWFWLIYIIHSFEIFMKITNW